MKPALTPVLLWRCREFHFLVWKDWKYGDVWSHYQSFKLHCRVGTPGSEVTDAYSGVQSAYRLPSTTGVSQGIIVPIE